MCREDIRVGRRKYSAASQITVVNGVRTPIVGASSERTHLTITSAGGLAKAVPESLDPTTNAGYPYGNGLHPIELDIETHGDIVTRAWIGAGDAADVLTLVMEAFWEDDKKL